MKHYIGLLVLIMFACKPTEQKNEFIGTDGEIKLITLDPGHFHAALIQKTPIRQLSSKVYVYAPKGVELDAHLALIESYNSRNENPTHWNERVYAGTDFFERMLSEKPGNVVMLAGNNQLKTSYIHHSVRNGLNVLADKPMAIDGRTFQELKEAFAIAEKKNVLLYDIMTERYDIIHIISRLLMQDENLFGTLERGTPEMPAVQMQSIHHFYKMVSGSPLVRPAWYYDVEQQGEGLVDVTTHLIDLIHWKCFPDIALDYEKDIEMTSAKHWPTSLSPSQFYQSTGMQTYPTFLNKYVEDSTLYVYANGQIHYQVLGVNVSLEVVWNFQAPQGAGDIHKTIIQGSKATVMILQDQEQQYIPRLYIRKNRAISEKDFRESLQESILKLQSVYPVSIHETDDDKIEIVIPSELKDGHEAHFSKVAEKYFDFLVSRNMPEWEIPNMLTKYYITTTALEMARNRDEF